MNNLEIALAWNKAGFAVFPCFEEDTWSGDSLRLRKSPDTIRGFYDATTVVNVIETYWKANPERLVGVRIPDEIAVLDIDIKLDPPVDGFETLELASLAYPNTFTATTPSGGQHLYYKKNASLEVKPTANLKLLDGRVLKGVDRRTKGSYTIAYSVDAPVLGELTDSPEWLIEPVEQVGINAYSGGLSKWLLELPLGDFDHRVSLAISRFPDQDFGHADMLRMQTELVKLGAESHRGVGEALEMLQALWLFGDYNTIQYQSEWNAALEGAVRKFGGRSPEKVLPEWKAEEFSSAVQTGSPLWADKIAAKVEEKYIELKALQLAANKIAAEGFTGSLELTIDDLKATKSVFLVQDLLPVDSIGFMVARSNLGKTFAYVDMCCRMMFGMPWLGKATSPSKIVIVLGEGKAGFYERLESWFEHHNQDPALIPEFMAFIDGANLFSDQSIEKISEVANRMNADLIVFDTWAATSGVAEENAGGLNSEALNRATKIRPGASLLFVHHPTKNSEKSDSPELRGSGALKGRADVVMTMYNDAKYRPATGENEEWIALSTEVSHAGKNRNARTETIRGIFLKSTELGGKVLMQLESETLSERARLVRTQLIGEMTVKEFAVKTNDSDSTAKRNLTAAVTEGIAERHVHPGSNVPDTYTLTKPDNGANPIDFSALIANSEAKNGAEEVK